MSEKYLYGNVPRDGRGRGRSGDRSPCGAERVTGAARRARPALVARGDGPGDIQAAWNDSIRLAQTAGAAPYALTPHDRKHPRGYTGNTVAKASAKRPRTKIQVPTTTSSAPAQLLICGALVRRRSRVASSAQATRRAMPKVRTSRVAAARAKARPAASRPPVEKACPARPARMGPVHPKPARRYPNPNRV